MDTLVIMTLLLIIVGVTCFSLVVLYQYLVSIQEALRAIRADLYALLEATSSLHDSKTTHGKHEG